MTRGGLMGREGSVTCMSWWGQRGVVRVVEGQREHCGGGRLRGDAESQGPDGWACW